MEWVEIQVCNWWKYQRHAARHKATGWLRIENTLYEHRIWELLTDAEYRAFMLMLMYVSRKGHKTGLVVVSLDALSRYSRKPPAVVRSMLGKASEQNISIVKIQWLKPDEISARAEAARLANTEEPSHGRSYANANDNNSPQPPSGGASDEATGELREAAPPPAPSDSGERPGDGGGGPSPTAWSPPDAQLDRICRAYETRVVEADIYAGRKRLRDMALEAGPQVGPAFLLDVWRAVHGYEVFLARERVRPGGGRKPKNFPNFLRKDYWRPMVKNCPEEFRDWPGAHDPRCGRRVAESPPEPPLTLDRAIAAAKNLVGGVVLTRGEGSGQEFQVATPTLVPRLEANGWRRWAPPAGVAIC